MKYERKTERKRNSDGEVKEVVVEVKYDGKRGEVVLSGALSRAKESNPDFFHDLRAIRWQDGGLGWVNRHQLTYLND